METATAKQRDNGDWEVTLNVKAQKSLYDSAGVMTEPAMDEWVQIGIYAANEDKVREPLHLEMHRIRSGEQKIKVTVKEKPARAGIDPNRLLDWEEGNGNNMNQVEINPNPAQLQ